ncbi:MAG: TIGR02757 family protein [Sulfurospirillaceae bacterium]|nr:TIGR02757 family protein [Sulfurospirillaceae bacterium]MDD2826230.1 TIGR02757 family protein [Sulfurospirillaceae bacterium]
MNDSELVALLCNEVDLRNNKNELSDIKPDPLMVASRYKEEYSALVCALFAYGDVRAIVSFLNSLDFSALNKDEKSIEHGLSGNYYRFQTSLDVQALFITLQRAKKIDSLENIFMQGYQKKYDVMDGLCSLITFLYDINTYRSRGYQFLLGKIPQKNNHSPYKRWHMYLRWMVRKDCLDLGLWKHVRTQDLLMPLDTHTFRIGKKLGLITRSTYDFKAVLELTQACQKFDKNDPVKFDFALYRLGQEKRIN